MFSIVWEREENRESGKPGRKFSLSGSQILSPQIGRKSLSGKLMKKTLSIMPYESSFKKKKKKKKNTERERRRMRAAHEGEKANKGWEIEI